MNFLELQELTAFWVRDPGYGYFTLPFIKRMVNNAAIELYKYLNDTGANRYLKCVTSSTVINQGNYSLPEDFSSVERLAFVTDPNTSSELEYPIMPLTLNQQNNFITPYLPNNGPTSYYFSKNNIVIAPLPQTVKTLRLHYAYDPAVMVLDSDVPDAPLKYHEFIALRAANSCKLTDQQPRRPFAEEIEAYLGNLKASAEERNRDVPRGIREVYDGGYDGWGY